MAILGMDGFDHYTTGSDGLLSSVIGYTLQTSNNVDVETTGTRFGSGKLLELYWDGGLKVNIGSDATNTIFVSFAFKHSLVNVTKSTILDIRGQDTQAHMIAYVNDAGNVEIYDGYNVKKGTSTNTMNEDTWYWIEQKAFVDDSGSYEIYVNGSLFYSLSATDFLRGTATPLIKTFGIFGGGNAGTAYYDDLVWQDDSGAYLGDSRIETFMPNGESSIQWTPSTGTDNSALVDEIPATDDTDYVSSSTVTHLDLYDVDALTDDDTIHAIGIHCRARKTDTGNRSIETRTKSSANEQGGVDFDLSTDYGSFQDVYETTDGGTTAWTKTLFDAAQFGVKVTV